MATVSVSSDPPATKPPKREDKKDKEKSAPGDDAGDGDGDDDGDDPTERLRAGMRARAASERARSHRSQSQESTADESARLLSLLSIAPTDAERSTMAAQRSSLPAAAARPDIIAACVDSASPAAVITGETGSGKTTQAPQFVLEHFVDAGHGARCGIVVCQPRRVAAVSIARRVAEERGEKVGDVVGYRVRGESRTSNRTRLTFCTTGVLLQRLQWDPTLADITHVFVDEAHERTADADFLLIHLRRLLRSGESKLRVTLMSATVDATKFTNYFAGAGSPRPGRSAHPGPNLPGE
jgi:HrpA-like RNA helicase